jgi:hypothetical protein
MAEHRAQLAGTFRILSVSLRYDSIIAGAPAWRAAEDGESC